MINMTTVFILAGGKSARMGEDKSTMFGGVNRLIKECQKASIDRIITLCGAESRMPLFEGEVWPDPLHCNSLVEVIRWSITMVEDDILLIPCDAFNLNYSGIELLINQSNCIPLDSNGRRQPLFARIVSKTQIDFGGESLNLLFAKFPELKTSKLAKQFENFNQILDLKNHS